MAKLDSLNEQNYWAPLQALADDLCCTLQRGNENGGSQMTAYFLIDGEKVAYVEPVTTFSYYRSSVTGYRAHGKYLPRKESRRGGYGGEDSWNFNYVQRKTLEAVIKELRPFLRGETPMEKYHREFIAKRDSMLVEIPRWRTGPTMDSDMAMKVLVAMYRDGMINDDRARLAKVGSEYRGMHDPGIPVLLEEVLAAESRRIDDQIGNEIVMELFRAAHAAGLKLAGLKEEA